MEMVERAGPRLPEAPQPEGVWRWDSRNPKSFPSFQAQGQIQLQVRKISNVLQAQRFLGRFCKVLKDDPVAKEDFAEGKNGASKLTKEQIDAVFEFSRSLNQAPSDFDKTAELWNSLVECRKQKMGKSSSTFKEAMEALELTIACGYLDKVKDEEKEEKSSEAKEGGKAKKDRRKDKEQGKNKQQQVRMEQLN